MVDEDIHEIGFLRDIDIEDAAEDVKTVQLVGDRGAVDVDVTDETMVEFLTIAEEVCRRIHADMEEVRSLLLDEPDHRDEGPPGSIE